MFLQLYLREKRHQFPLGRSLGGLRASLDTAVARKQISLVSLLGSNLGRQALSLLTVLTINSIIADENGEFYYLRQLLHVTCTVGYVI